MLFHIHCILYPCPIVASYKQMTVYCCKVFELEIQQLYFMCFISIRYPDLLSLHYAAKAPFLLQVLFLFEGSMKVFNFVKLFAFVNLIRHIDSWADIRNDLKLSGICNHCNHFLAGTNINGYLKMSGIKCQHCRVNICMHSWESSNMQGYSDCLNKFS